MKAWKHKLMQSENLSYQWLKNQPQDNDISMKLPNGKFTANTDEQLNEIAKAWLPIFQKFVNCLPDMKHFDENFAPFLSPDTKECETQFLQFGRVAPSVAHCTEPLVSGPF